MFSPHKAVPHIILMGHGNGKETSNGLIMMIWHVVLLRVLNKDIFWIKMNQIQRCVYKEDTLQNLPKALQKLSMAHFNLKF